MFTWSRRWRVLVAAVAALVVVAGVVGACATPGGGGGGPLARDYVPLAVGHRWSYVVRPGPAEPQPVTIVSVDGAGFYVNDQGGKLAPRTDGVFDGTRFILKDPLTAGATWSAIPKGQPAEQYTITAVGSAVTVPAGTFADCVEVEGVQPGIDPNTGKAGKLLITWTYAKGVGLVKIVQRIQVGDAAPVVGATMELATFAPAQAAP